MCISNNKRKFQIKDEEENFYESRNSLYYFTLKVYTTYTQNFQ